jgi:hypothetical protein
MGVSFRCILKSKTPWTDSFATDGKNLAMAYMGTLMGGLDLDTLMDESLDLNMEEADTAAESPTIFAALDDFLTKSGGQTPESVQQWYSATAGLTAIANTLGRLRSAEGIASVPNEEVREGCICDLEAYAKMLMEAQRQGTPFVFAFDV